MIKYMNKARIITIIMVLLFAISTTVCAMQIFVKIGTEPAITLEVDAEDTITSVKEKIETKKGIPTNVQQLIIGEIELEDKRTLSDYSVNKEAIITLVINGIAATVESHEVAGITETSAIGGGNITDIGVPNPTAYGVCWNTEETPTIKNAHNDEGVITEAGAFTSDMGDLTPETLYYVRAYVTNYIGTSYGSQVSFTTNPEVDLYEGVTIVVDGTTEIDITEPIETFTVTAKLMKDGEEIDIPGTEYVWSVFGEESKFDLTTDALDSSMCEVKIVYGDFSYGGYGTSYKVSIIDHLDIETRVPIDINKERPYYIDTIKGIGAERKAVDYEVVLPLMTVYDVNYEVVSKPLLVTCETLGEDFTYNGDGTVTLSKDVALGTYTVVVKILGNEDIDREFDLSISEKVSYGEVTDMQVHVDLSPEVNVSFKYDGDATALLDLKAQVFPVGYPALALGSYMDAGNEVLEEDLRIFPQLIGAKGGEVVPYTFEVVMRGKDGTNKVWRQAFEYIVPDFTFETEEGYKIDDGNLAFTVKSLINHSGTEFVNTSKDDEMAEFRLLDLTEVRRQYEAYGLTLDDLMKSRQVVMGMGGMSTNGEMMYKKKLSILKDGDYYMYMFYGNDEIESETMVSISDLFQASIPTPNPSSSRSNKASTSNTVKGEAGDKSFSAGTQKSTYGTDGEKQIVVMVEKEAIKDEVDMMDVGSKISIPITGLAPLAKGIFSVQSIKDMQMKKVLLEVKTDQATYELPTGEIDIKAISDIIGEEVALKDIAFAIEISTTSTEMAKIIENSAEESGLSIVVPSVNFEIKASYKDKTYKVDTFKAFVTRTIEIPENIDANKITTAIITDVNGHIRHVPTYITMVNGKYYATINSLTNSTYTLINNDVTFSDITDGYWAKADIEKMANRLIVEGEDDGTFLPSVAIKRGELSEIIVKALGLKPEEVEKFIDVEKGTECAGYIGTAYSYGIIKGTSDTTCNPNGYVTRQDAMVMIYRASLIAGGIDEAYMIDMTLYEDDLNVSEYAKNAVMWNVKNHIIVGKTDTTLAPLDHITRAEVSVVINRFLVEMGLIE